MAGGQRLYINSSFLKNVVDVLAQHFAFVGLIGLAKFGSAALVELDTRKWS